MVHVKRWLGNDDEGDKKVASWSLRIEFCMCRFLSAFHWPINVFADWRLANLGSRDHCVPNLIFCSVRLNGPELAGGRTTVIQLKRLFCGFKITMTCWLLKWKETFSTAITAMGSLTAYFSSERKTTKFSSSCQGPIFCKLVVLCFLGPSSVGIGMLLKIFMRVRF